MSSFEPPPYDSPVFNSGLFNTLDEVVTIDYADKNYFKLSGCLVKGFSTFNAGLSVNGGLALDGSNVDLSSISGITAGTAQANKALILNGSKNISNINQLNSTGSSSVIFSNNTAINSTYHQWINNSMSPNIVCRVQLNNDSATMGVSSSHPLKIMTAGLTRQFITSTGLIGINNTNPLYQLDIDGSLNTTNSMYMNGTEIIDASRNIKNIVNLTATTLSGTIATPTQPNITSVGTLTDLTVSGGIDGVLTTPAQPNITSLGTLTGLTVSGNINGLSELFIGTRITMQNTDYGLSHRNTLGTCELVTYNSGNEASMGSYSNHPFSLTCNNIDRLRLNTNGSVSIGNTNSTYKLDVQGSIRSTNLRIDNEAFDLPAFIINPNDGIGGVESGLRIYASEQKLLTHSNIGFWNPDRSVCIGLFSTTSGVQNCFHIRPQSTADVSASLTNIGLMVGSDAIFRKGILMTGDSLTPTSLSPDSILDIRGKTNIVDGSYQKVARFCSHNEGNVLEIQCSTTSANPCWIGTKTASQLRFGANNATFMTMREDSLILGSTSGANAPLHIATTFSYTLGSALGLDTVYRLRTNNGVTESATSPITYNIGIFCNSLILSLGLCQVSDKRKKCEFADIDIKHVERFYDTIKPQSYYYKSNMTVREYGLIAQDCLKNGFSDLVGAIPNEEMRGVIEDPEVDMDAVEFNINYQRITMFNQIMIKNMSDKIKRLEDIIDKLIAKPAINKWISK